MRYAGEMAALATAGCWTASALSFTTAGRRIGSLPVNLMRLALAQVFLAVIGLTHRGLALPTDASARYWALLSVSGIIGLFIGDLCLFRSFLLIGPRLAMLIMSLWPAFAALLSWLAFGETLTGMKLAGMAVTLAGIAWVTAERHPEDPSASHHVSPQAKTRGVVLAVLGAAGQAGGYVLARPVMHEEYDAFAATQIRSLAALACFVILFTAMGLWGRVWAARKDPFSLALTVNGAVWGPCIGVALSLMAMEYVAVGVASTLSSTSPVIMIPFIIWLYREKVSWRAAIGAGIAVVGVAMLWIDVPWLKHVLHFPSGG